MSVCICGCGLTPLRGVYVQGHGPHTSQPRWILDEAGCWIWNRHIGSDGYGRCEVTGGRVVQAHRVVWQECWGIDLPDEVALDHLCRVIACVNPEHLEPVTSAENQRRSRTTGLTMEVADLIRASTEKQTVVGARFGVSRQCVSDIRRGVRWAPEDTTAVDQVKALMVGRVPRELNLHVQTPRLEKTEGA